MAPALSAVERWLLAIVAITCLAFTLLTPPFQAPDEPQHLARSVRLAQGKVFAERDGTRIGGVVPRAFAELSTLRFSREAFEQPTRYTGADLAATAALADQTPVFVEFANVANYAPTLYAPQAVGVAIGRGVGASALACFYLARLVNVIVFLGLLWGAVRLLPFGRLVLLGIAALPTVAYQGASVSPDATINGLGWLAVALSLAGGFAVARRGWTIATAIPLGLCKGLYVPLLLAGARGRNLVWAGLATVVGAGAFVAWTLAAGGDQAVYLVESRVTGELLPTAPLSDQLRVVLGDPLGYVRILVSSMAERSPVYALQLVGRFGWNAILLPILAYPLAFGVVALGVLAGIGTTPSRWDRLWWFALGAGVIVLVETALYLTGTPYAATYVQGTQGRYFLPALPLLLLAVAPGASGWRTRLVSGRTMLVAAAVLNAVAVLTVVDAFWIGGFVNHRGLPPFAHDAAGIARMLLLPSPRW